jgi:hypothetical protein
MSISYHLGVDSKHACRKTADVVKKTLAIAPEPVNHYSPTPKPI